MDKETVNQARVEAEQAHTKLNLLRECYNKALVEYNEKSELFRKLDYELALEDGRLIKLPSATPGQRKMKKQPELSLDQLKAIATKLGFDLTEVDEVDEEESEEEMDEESIKAIMEDV